MESILNQTFQDFEFIIVIEYGCNDETRNILDYYRRIDPRITVIENQKRLGIAASLNVGFDLASGDYIARMDADDICVPERLQLQIDFMKQNPYISISGGEIKYIDENSKLLEGSDRFPQDSELIKSGLLFYCYLRHPTVIMRREDINAAGLRYDESYEATEDFELWNRACHLVKIGNIPQVILFYRWFEGNATHKNDESGIRNYLRVMNQSFKSMNMELSQKDLEYLCPITCKITLHNYKEVKQLFAWFEKEILEKNSVIGMYDQSALKIILKKRIYWERHPGRLYASILLRLIAQLFDKRLVKTKLINSAANYLEIYGFFKSLRYIASKIK